MPFNHPIVMVGFGAMGQSLLPLLWKHLDFKPSQFFVITDNDEGRKFAEEYQLDFKVNTLTPANYSALLKPLLNEGALLLNMSVDVCSADLIKLCQQQNALYVDLSTEPWEGGYTNKELPPYERTNYALRELCLRHRKKDAPTAVMTHGANPGLVSHLVKKALLDIARDNNLTVKKPQTSDEWAKLAQALEIKAIHIAERDTQTSTRPYDPNEFMNTWSVDGLISEALQPAELGWGTHERQLPPQGKQHEYGCNSAIYIEKPGGSIKVRSWTPSWGAYHGFLITHAESVSIASYFTLREDDKVSYRPTVHYAYHPCPSAVISMHHFMGNQYQDPPKKHVMLDDIDKGTDELGVLLMGNKKGAYWYGSTLTIEEARSLAPHNSATSLQVVSGALAAIIWAIEHPQQGLVEPDDIDYDYILDKARPYLGKVQGYYTDWTPLDGRNELFEEEVDANDPWQFSNIVVK